MKYFKITKMSKVYQDYLTLVTQYSSSPGEFADYLMKNILTMDPKVVRAILYQLHQLGGNMDEVYRNWIIKYPQEIPSFLYHLDTLSSETLFLLLKYGFPPVIHGNLFLWWSLSSYGDWLNRALEIINYLTINLDYQNKESGGTLLHQAIDSLYLPSVMVLLYYKANPNINYSDGSTTADHIRQLFTLGTNQEIVYEIVKQLRKYGLIFPEPYSSKLARSLAAGDKLFSLPHKYYEPDLLYFSLHELENNHLATTLSSTFSTWPYYIDSTKDNDICPEIDNLPVIDPLPDVHEVYTTVLKSYRDEPAYIPSNYSYISQSQDKIPTPYQPYPVLTEPLP